MVIDLDTSKFQVRRCIGFLGLALQNTMDYVALIADIYFLIILEAKSMIKVLASLVSSGVSLSLSLTL